jgi:MFS family permease
VDSPQQVARFVARAAQAGGVSPLAVLPLVAITGLGLLATDLYLPSVPHLPQLLGGTLEQAQFTLVAFMTALAPMQLVYGVLADAFGTLRVLLAAILLLSERASAAQPRRASTSWSCFAFFRGAGAAAAAAIVPAVIRTLPSQVGLGLRGGLTMSAAMGAQPDREASAAALLSFIAFVLAAGGNALVAPFLHLGLAPVVVACLLFCFTSLAAYGVYEATRWNRAQPDATE